MERVIRGHFPDAAQAEAFQGWRAECLACMERWEENWKED